MKRKKKLPKVIPKRYFTVLDSIFHQKVHVFLNHSEADFKKWMKKIGAEYDNDVKESNEADFSGYSSSMTTDTGKTEWLIVLKHFDWTIKDQGTLIHEIVHTIIKIWKSNNIPHNYDTQEFLAHSVSNLYEDVCRKLLV